MADRLAHPLHLVLAALVQRQLEPRRAEAAHLRRARCDRPPARRPRPAAATRRRTASPRPPPRTPCPPRSAGARAGGRAAPSFVSSSAPVVSASRRPTGTTRASWSTSSTTVGRPPGSRAVVTTPAGLWRSTYASRCFVTGLPSTSTTSSPETNVLSWPGSPFTVTRPATISSSALRRDATPARRQESVQPHSAILAAS